MAWPGVLPEAQRRSNVVNLIDVGATLIAAAGAPGLPRSRGRSLLDIASDPDAPWLDETFSEYVTDLSSTWTGPEAACQRMLRHGRYKYVHMDGFRPQLFDLESDPLETRDLAENPAYDGVITWCAERVLAGWDPAIIRREVADRCAEKAILRDWGRLTEPPSKLQYAISDEDSWLDSA